MEQKSFSQNPLVFINSKGQVLSEGEGHGKGILYCGKKYTQPEECRCKTCDGQCGPENGCPCPECEELLSYALSCTRKLICGKCGKKLLRLSLKSLSKLIKSSMAFECDICNAKYKISYTPVFHCFTCNYNVCPACSFSYLKPQNLENYTANLPENGKENGEGMLYCGKNYAEDSGCVCGGCDGNCGPTNGCPCPTCSSILGYNIAISGKNICGDCKECKLIKITLKELSTYDTGYKSGFECDVCGESCYEDYIFLYHCSECGYDVCSKCAYKWIEGKLVLPPLPGCGNFNVDDLLKNIKEIQDNANKTDNGANKNEDNEDNYLCVICLTDKKNVAFLPCKHLCCCEECSKKVKECPMCRKKVEDTIKLYI